MTDAQVLLKIQMMEAHLASAMQLATELRKVSGAATPGTTKQDVAPTVDPAKLRARFRAKVIRKSNHQ